MNNKKETENILKSNRDLIKFSFNKMHRLTYAGESLFCFTNNNFAKEAGTSKRLFLHLVFTKGVKELYLFSILKAWARKRGCS